MNDHVPRAWAADADLCERFEFAWAKTSGDPADIDRQVGVLAAVRARFLARNIDPMQFRRWGFELLLYRMAGGADVENHFKIITDPLSKNWQEGVLRRPKHKPAPHHLKDFGWYLYPDDCLPYVWAVSAQGLVVTQKQDERVVAWVYGWT